MKDRNTKVLYLFDFSPASGNGFVFRELHKESFDGEGGIWNYFLKHENTFETHEEMITRCVEYIMELQKQIDVEIERRANEKNSSN